jgi:hypothetical protein
MSFFSKRLKKPKKSIPVPGATGATGAVATGATGGTSGEHPAVQSYRGKLQSIEDGVGETARALDEELEAYLKHVSTPPPPPPDKDNAE